MSLDNEASITIVQDGARSFWQLKETPKEQSSIAEFYRQTATSMVAANHGLIPRARIAGRA